MFPQHLPASSLLSFRLEIDPMHMGILARVRIGNETTTYFLPYTGTDMVTVEDAYHHVHRTLREAMEHEHFVTVDPGIRHLIEDSVGLVGLRLNDDGEGLWIKQAAKAVSTTKSAIDTVMKKVKAQKL